MNILEIAGDALDPLAERIIDSAKAGKSVIAVIAETPGTGCTTATLCLAQKLSVWGAKIALVDASFGRPALGERLGLSITGGWDHVLHGWITLPEAVIASQVDNMVLLPLASALDLGSESDILCGIQTAVGIGVLRDQYDVTLIDVGAMDAMGQSPPYFSRFAAHVGIEGLVTTLGSVEQDTALGQRLASQLETASLPTLGVLENRVA